MCRPIGLAHDLAEFPVPAAIVGYKEKPKARAFGERELSILRLLQPSFEAAVKTLQRFHTAGAELLSQVDRLSRAVVIISSNGVVHANPAFTALFGAE